MKAFFPGSFNPFTAGHLDILIRARKIFPEICIGIGFNEHKDSSRDMEAILKQLEKLFIGIPGISVTLYSGLTASAARKAGANFIIRGFRNAMDAEYERNLAETNRELFGIDTLLFAASPALSLVSSSMVRELSHNGYDVAKFVPSEKEVRDSLNFTLNE